MHINCTVHLFSRSYSLTLSLSHTKSKISERADCLAVLLIARLNVLSFLHRGLILHNYLLQIINVVCFYKNCCHVIKPEQPKMICWLCDRMVHTKCAGFIGRTSDDLARGQNRNLQSAKKPLVVGCLRRTPRNDGQMINRNPLSIAANPHMLLKKIRRNPINPLGRDPPPWDC